MATANRRAASATSATRLTASCAWPGRRCDPVNIGNPDEFTILDCARLVLKVTGSKSTIAYEPLPEDDPQQRRPDITRARQLLGWEPKINLEAGLRLSMPYFQEVIALEEKVAAKSVPAAR